MCECACVHVWLDHIHTIITIMYKYIWDKIDKKLFLPNYVNIIDFLYLQSWLPTVLFDILSQSWLDSDFHEYVHFLRITLLYTCVNVGIYAHPDWIIFTLYVPRYNNHLTEISKGIHIWS